MAQTQFVGLRIPDQILAQVDRLVGSSAGASRSAVLLGLIEKGLGTAPSADTAEILQRLEAIEKKLPLPQQSSA